MPRHACHVSVGIKVLPSCAISEGLRALPFEDHLVADVVIALLISSQLSLGRMYHRCRARCVVVALRLALSLQRPRDYRRASPAGRQP
jgi:hypothetical protein